MQGMLQETMIMKQFKYIGQIDPEDLQKEVVHACINEQGFRCILIKNAAEKRISFKYDTDNLDIKLNAVLYHGQNEYFYHIITAKKNDIDSIKGFELIYEYVFMKITNAISDEGLSGLVSSIEEYFKITPDRDFQRIQIGVWGELFAIRELYEAGYKEIIHKYHSDFYSKHDVEITDRVRAEIKTTIGSKRIHHFAHEQLYRQDATVYVISNILEESQEGVSLYDLFLNVLDLYQNPESKLALRKLMKKCNISDTNEGIRIAYARAKSEIRAFLAEELPMLKTDTPNGVTNIEYDVDCSFAEGMKMTEFANILLAMH